MAYVNLLQVIYPVGSYYISGISTSPSSIIGGSWTQIDGGRFLCAAGSSYTAGATGGSASVTLTVNQMPTHWHDVQENSTGSWLNCGVWRTNVSGGSNWWMPAGGSFEGDPRLATATTGGSQSHENRPPYIVAYIWRRTA